ncbi:hypothetical protein E3A20_28850 [Planctomyces bekefii]|uniref:Uncharacterized protein n=1 Tax=Planctomyces bekefii TaxID=1653850 RepID=A0A5C6M1E8_9PLAN|nr:hypothetical protein E3A20_28850 [Planctomyces bekefii]
MAGSDVNEQGPANGMTPLHDAVQRGRVDVAKLLLEFDANPAIEDYAGRTPRDLVGNRPELLQLFSNLD